MTDIDVDEMLRSLKTWPCSKATEGNHPLDAPALRSLLFRVSALVDDLPHVAELDLNPVLVAEQGKGCIVLDARIRMTTPRSRKPSAPGTRTERRTGRSSDRTDLNDPQIAGRTALPPLRILPHPRIKGLAGASARNLLASTLPAKEVVAMVVALWIIAVVACCSLCGWGIATAVRRSKERRAVPH